MTDKKPPILMPVPANSAVAEQIPADDKPTIIIDKVLGTGETTLYIFGDLEYLLQDAEEYTSKLNDARGIPQDIAHIDPNHPVLAVIEALPEIQAMPKTTRLEQEVRNRRVGDIVRDYFTQLSKETTNSGIMCALCINGNDNLPPAVPYEEPVIRQRPGLITLPPPKKNLENMTEQRLKQLLDRVVLIPGALRELNEAIELMAIDVRRRLAPRDATGFLAQ